MARSRLQLAFIVLMTLVLIVPLTPVAAQETATPSATAATEEADWPMFRANPARTGAAAGPGPVGTPGVRWRVETGGGQASPAVVDGVVYIASDSWYFWALDAATGEEIWQVPGSPGIGSAPAVGDGLVVIGGSDDLRALDAATGEQRWLVPAGEESGTFAWASPVLADGTVYAIDFDGILYALDAATGDERWRFESEVTLASGPAVADGTVYIATEPVFNSEGDAAEIIALDAVTGEQRWRSAVTVEGDTFFSTPAVVDGGLYIGSQHPDGPGALRAFDLASGQERWRFEVPHAAVFSSPAVAGGVVYVGGNGLYAVDAATGDLSWRLGIGDVVSSPAVVDGVVYVSSEEGYLVAADAKTGAELWTVEIGGGGAQFRHSSPAVVDGMVYIHGLDHYVYALGEVDAATTPDTGTTSEAGAAFAELAPEVLAEVTIAADLLPPTPAFADAIITTWPVGVGYRNEQDSGGVSATCVLSGRWAYSLLEPAESRDGTPPGGTPGPETTLEAGECVTLAVNVPRDERNAGNEPLELLNIAIWPEDVYGLGNLPSEIELSFYTIFLWVDLWGQLPPGPVTLTVQRATLEPDGIVAAYAGAGIGEIGALEDPSSHVSKWADGSVRNLDDGEIEIFQFSAQPAGPEPADVTNNQFQIFAPDGTHLETWGTVGSGNGEFDFYRAHNEPGGSLAFDADGSLFVADAGNHRIQILSPGGLGQCGE